LTAPGPGEALLALEDADLAPPGAPRPVLTGVSLTLHRGEIAVLLGANGSGKTTLLRAAAGLWPLARGRRWGPDPDATGLLLEDPAAQFVARSVRGEIAFALENRIESTEAIARRTGEALRDWGLEALAERDPAGLSPGEQERALLAASLAVEPTLLLLDDPYLYLGPDEEHGAWEATIAAVREGRVGAALLATQDAELAVAADRVGLLDAGRLIRWGSPDDVLAAALPDGVEPPLGRWLEDALAASGPPLAGRGYDVARMIQRLLAEP
jgi:energy-coupling factor transporter ATP-binding protein EcfA2